MTLLVAGAIQFVLPGEPIAALFAIPVLIAAYRSSPRIVWVTTGVAIVLSTIANYLQAGLPTWYLRSLSFSVIAVAIAYLSMLLSSERERTSQRAKDAQLEQQRAQELAEEAQRASGTLRALIDTAPVGIGFYAAPDGHPELFNKAAEKVLGQLPVPGTTAVEQASFYNVSLPDGSPFPSEQLPLIRSLRGEVCVGVEALIRQPSGREVYLLVNSSPLRDAKGQITGVVLAFQDITRIKEQEQLRDEFISAAAHELRTPVTTIKGYAQLMRLWTPEGHEPREAAALAVIDAQCNRINRRVQEMLEAVRFRTIPPELHRVRFDLSDLAAQVVERMQAITQTHRLVLKREGLVPVEADRERIEEVLVSLVDNAIKFSPQGGEVEVRAWAQAGEGLVSVKDYGMGIAGDRQSHVFEPFYEYVPYGAPGYRGTVTLSLYLAKLTVERHKGRIWFESEPGKGSTFSFALPLA